MRPQRKPSFQRERSENVQKTLTVFNPISAPIYMRNGIYSNIHEEWNILLSIKVTWETIFKKPVA